MKTSFSENSDSATSNKKCIPPLEHVLDKVTILKKGNHRTAPTHASNSIDSSIDPCNDFYDFACGQIQDSPFFIDSERMNLDLWNIIESPKYFDNSREMKLVQTFHNSCMDRSEIVEILKSFKEISQKIGGCPIFESEQWNETAYDWVASIRQMRDVGLEANYLFSTSVQTNFQNTSIRSLLVKFLAPFFSM